MCITLIFHSSNRNSNSCNTVLYKLSFYLYAFYSALNSTEVQKMCLNMCFVSILWWWKISLYIQMSFKILSLKTNENVNEKKKKTFSVIFQDIYGNALNYCIISPRFCLGHHGYFIHCWMSIFHKFHSISKSYDVLFALSFSSHFKYLVIRLNK